MNNPDLTPQTEAATNNPSSATWPVLRLTLPPGATEDDTLILTQAASEAGALGSQAGSGLLLVYAPREDEAVIRQIEAALRSECTRALGWAEPEMAWDTLADAPWATAWKADFVALQIGERLLVRPDWEQGTAIPPDWQTREVIYIRPGGGFGTARHETTRLALELMEDWVQSEARVLDFGAGSGILAIAAARLGAGRVIAIEHDPEAIVNARENIDLNGVSERIELRQSAAPEENDAPFNLIICNMLPHEARPHWVTLAGLLAAGNTAAGSTSMPSINSVLIYSGLLADQKTEIAAELAEVGLHARNWTQAGEWMAAVFGSGRE